MIDYKAILSRAIYDYEAKLGSFLSSGKEILELHDRAQVYTKTSNNLVKQQALAVVAKSQGLLTSFQSIQEQAFSTAKAAADLRSKMDSDPTWRQILSADFSSMGWETIKVAKNMIGQSSGLGADLAIITRRLSQHLGGVETLRRDVSDLDSFAQGKGVKATLGAFAGWGGSTVKTVATVAAIAAVAVYLLPVGLARAARR